MSIDKKSLALGLAIGGKWNLLNAQGDRSVLLPVEVWMGRRLPATIDLGAAPTRPEGGGEAVLTAAYGGAAVHGVTACTDAAGLLAEGERAVPSISVQTL